MIRSLLGFAAAIPTPEGPGQADGRGDGRKCKNWDPNWHHIAIARSPIVVQPNASGAPQPANDHLDIFGGAIIHSPVGSNAGWVQPTASAQRYVLTGGTAEAAGSVHRSADVPRQIVDSLQRNHATLRWCIGRWAHEGPAWRDLSPGSVVWLLNLGDPSTYATPQEAANCHVSDATPGADTPASDP